MPSKVVIDTDPGIDDAQAIVFAIMSGAFEVQAITTVFGNCRVRHATRNALHLLQLMDRQDIPVFIGADRPLVRRRLPAAGAISVHGPTGTGDVILPRAPSRLGAARGAAAAELVRMARTLHEDLTVLAIGPLTNIALAMRLEPRFMDLIGGIIWMGGIVRGPRNVGPFATANALNDVEAAAIVFAASKRKLTMVGQDVTRDVRITARRLDRIRRAGPIGAYLHSIALHYRDAYRVIEPYPPGFPVHDLLVMAYTLRPELFRTELLHVRVETTGSLTAGMTVADLRQSSRLPKDVTVCVEAAGDEILDWYLRVLRSQ